MARKTSTAAGGGETSRRSGARTRRKAAESQPTEVAAALAPADSVRRCSWGGTPQMIAYHDTEWGVPLHDDRRLFEAIVLGGVQAGLSWRIVLAKRDNYRRVFADFEAARVARFNARKIEQLLANPGIVRNRLKVTAAVHNARACVKVQEEFGSLDAYLWQFVEGRPKRNAWRSLEQMPTCSPEAEAMSRDLVARGFKFVGPTICYATMQAVGMINDHLVHCFRYRAVGG